MFQRFNEITKEKFTAPAAVAGLSAALLLSPGVFNQQAHAEDLNNNSAANATYSYAGKSYTQQDIVPDPQAPTAERPYHYLRMDEQTKARFGDISVASTILDHGDKLVVLNFIDEGTRFSAMQSQVLQQSMAAVAERSQAKELMLVDVVVRDKQGNDVNMASYGAYIQDSDDVEMGVMPYGVVIGDPLKVGSGERRLFDFSLMNGVKTDADLNANANAIAGNLYITVKGYNDRVLAAVNNDIASTLVSNELR